MNKLQRLSHLVNSAISFETMSNQQFSDVLATAGYTDLNVTGITNVEVKENERTNSYRIVVEFRFIEEGVFETGKVYGFLNSHDVVLYF